MARRSNLPPGATSPSSSPASRRGSSATARRSPAGPAGGADQARGRHRHAVVVVLVGGSAITMSRWLDKSRPCWRSGTPARRAGGRRRSAVRRRQSRRSTAYHLSGRRRAIAARLQPQADRPRRRLRRPHRPAPLPLRPWVSYTRFIQRPVFRTAAIAAGETAPVRCTVSNTGPRAGEEVVQLYLRDELASVARP